MLNYYPTLTLSSILQTHREIRMFEPNRISSRYLHTGTIVIWDSFADLTFRCALGEQSIRIYISGRIRSKFIVGYKLMLASGVRHAFTAPLPEPYIAHALVENRLYYDDRVTIFGSHRKTINYRESWEHRRHRR